MAVLSLDLGSALLKALLLTESKGQYHLVWMEFQEREWEKPLVPQLKALLSKIPKKFRWQTVVVSFPSHKALFRENHIAFADPEQIAKVVKASVEPTLTLQDVDSMIVLYRVVESSKEKGSRLCLSCVPKETVRQTLEMLRQAGIEPQRLYLDFSGPLFLLEKEGKIQKEKNQLFLDLGARWIRLVFWEKGRLSLIRTILRPLPFLEEPALEEDSYEAFKRKHSQRILETSSHSQRQETSARLSVFDPEATDMFEALTIDEESLFESEILEEVGEESEELIPLTEAVGGKEVYLLDSDLYLSFDHESEERVPVAVLSEEEFKTLEIYEDYEEVSEVNLEGYIDFLTSEIEKSLVYLSLDRLDEIFLAGGGALLEPLSRKLEVLAPVQKLSPPRTFEGNPKNFALMASTLGMALEAFHEESEWDVRKEEFIYQSPFKEVKRLLGMSFFLLSLILFLLFQNLSEKKQYIHRKVIQIQKNQQKVYYTLFQSIAPKEAPLYPENIAESVKEKLRELEEELGEKGSQEIVSALLILKEIAKAVARSKVPVELQSLNISQRGGQIKISVPSNESLSLLASAFQKSQHIQIVSYDYQKTGSVLQFQLKGK